MASTWGTSWGTAWATSWGGETVEPPVILVGGGDDAPRKRKRRGFHELAQELEETIRGLVLPPALEAVPERAGASLTPGEAGRALDELVVLAQGQHALLQRAAALRAELQRLEDDRAQARAAFEQDEEDALIWMF
jgi:hypothetical protein